MTDIDGEQIYVFEIDHAYVFKHYFEREAVFEAIGDFYDPDEYRFEVPGSEWGDVATTLGEYGVEPIVVEDTSDFVVVKEEYTSHAEILRRSVAHWSRRGHNFFLMPEPYWVERAVEEEGAMRAAETDLVVGL